MRNEEKDEEETRDISGELEDMSVEDIGNDIQELIESEEGGKND